MAGRVKSYCLTCEILYNEAEYSQYIDFVIISHTDRDSVGACTLQSSRYSSFLSAADAPVLCILCRAACSDPPVISQQAERASNSCLHAPERHHTLRQFSEASLSDMEADVAILGPEFLWKLIPVGKDRWVI
jgi:hypothetical protein